MRPDPDAIKGLSLQRSRQLNDRLHDLIPGGAHTYAKGDDQFPEGLAPVISGGRGCHVWDVDGNDYIEYGMGLRAVTLGHGFPRVVEAVRERIGEGTNFVRPSALELQAAESFVDLIDAADMVKFTKDGSTANTAAVKLARAFTGRDLVAICIDHPFYSYDDWAMVTTPIKAGIPKASKRSRSHSATTPSRRSRISSNDIRAASRASYSSPSVPILRGTASCSVSTSSLTTRCAPRPRRERDGVPLGQRRRPGCARHRP